MSQNYSGGGEREREEAVKITYTCEKKIGHGIWQRIANNGHNPIKFSCVQNGSANKRGFFVSPLLRSLFKVPLTSIFFIEVRVA